MRAFSVSNRNGGARFSRSITQLVLLVLLFAGSSLRSIAQSWTNPCASTKALSTQTTTLKQGADATEVCSFLDRTYAEIDNRCGIELVSRLWPPDKWFHPRHPYDVIPNEVLQDIPRGAFASENNPWIELSIPPLARLMTTGIPGDTGGGAPSGNGWIQSIQAPSPTPNTLHFNPLLQPEILLDPGSSNSLHKVTCTGALTASESGSITIPVASASQKFSAQENSTSAVKLVYGTFLSPLSYLADTHSSTFFYEVLDFYQRYQNATNSVVSTGASIYYPTRMEGVIVYNTIKGQLSTDTTANASVTYAVPLGGVNASASGEATFVDSSSAYLFHALVRQVTWAKLPKLAEVLADLNKVGKNLISATNTNNKVAAYDSASKRIKASFVMEGMPSTLCSSNVWKVSSPVPSDLSLSSWPARAFEPSCLLV